MTGRVQGEVYTPQDVEGLMAATGYRTQEEFAEATRVTDRTVRYWLVKGVTSPGAIARLDALEPRLAFKAKFEKYQAERLARMRPPASPSPAATPAAQAPGVDSASMSWEAPPGDPSWVRDERPRKVRLPVQQQESRSAPKPDPAAMSWEAPPGDPARVRDERPRKLRLPAPHASPPPLQRPVRPPRRRWGLFAAAGILLVLLSAAVWKSGCLDQAVSAPENSSIGGEPIPSTPLKDQARPPCPLPSNKIFNGGCWDGPFEDDRPPCSEGHYSRNGKCYLPHFGPPKPSPFSQEHLKGGG